MGQQVHNIGSSSDWVVMVIYFIFILLFGTYFSKYNKNTNDFFFGGRRFAWWIIAMSIVATGVSSHSFVKYSAKGFQYGLSSTMTYLNDWFFVPFFIFGWLPIIVYSRVRSIPEYFERRFNPTARFIATILQLLYLVGYVGIGFLTMGKAILPLLPESITFFGLHFSVTLMGTIVVVAAITGAYITFGGQTAVIFTDLVQGFMLLLAGFLVFSFGIYYVGGWDSFWNILPVDFKLPFAHFNEPPDFNFVGIFWQDGVAGSIGFLFMNMGLIMRFMATKSVDEGRKAATFNILFMLPLSAIVVGNAGWIGKAISLIPGSPISANADPDSIFVVVANLIALPGVFGFVIAALIAALMSTVSTLINAAAAVYVNDVERPLRKWLKRVQADNKAEEKSLLNTARISSVLFTILGVIIVIPFNTFPTVYEAHGFFHSTLTPPLVVAIFLGFLWKKFNPSAVIASFIGGVALMILGAYYPDPLISFFAQGTRMDPAHPFIYIGALYNTLVCVFVAIAVVLVTPSLYKIVGKIKDSENKKSIIYTLIALSSAIFLAVAVNLFSIWVLVILSLLMSFMVALTTMFYVKYDPDQNTIGLTIWDIAKAKEMFKGKKINDSVGKTIRIKWKLKDTDDETINFSVNDMKLMAAEKGDFVYLCDARKYLGGLKSFHSVYGEPHNEDGIVYISQDQFESALFSKGKILTADKEM
ncbi:MAG: sodium:proline symporter [Ignavibacteriae bacterium HGW-Ignavibacteriae-2]|jgi:SSS family solute:Na+ symporter|nr:MAG: sodium:proline symporter [Ignavibacteriae bacterium HGW-Ignavibacteriae-2]